MKNKYRRIIGILLIIAWSFGLMPASVSAAGYTLWDSGFTKLSTLPNTNVATQGMAADDNYIYTFKMPSGNNNNAIIYRTDIHTRGTIALTNAADPSTTVLSELGHGNDMCAVVHNGKTYLYLATMYHTGHSTYSTHSIWKLEVSGTTVRKVAYYDVFDGSSSLNFTGLTVHSQSSTSVRLLGHISTHVFYMDIGLDQASGSVNVGYGCSLNYKSVTVPTGAPSYNASYYEVQGMTYNNGLLYFVMTANSSNTPRNKNFILAYDVSNLGVDTSQRKNLQEHTIYLTSSYYSFFLEIESLCAVNGRMYFSANAGSGSSYYSAEDFVGHLNQYFHTDPDGVLLNFDSGSRESRWGWKHYIGSAATAIAPAPTVANGALSGRLGVLSVEGQTSTDSFVRMTAGDVYYRIGSGDIVEIGVNYHCVSGTPPTSSTVFFTSNNIGYFTPERMFNCAHHFVEGKNTLQYKLSGSAAVGEIISQLRIDLFEGGSADFLADYSIDYIYIGPEANSPGTIEKYTGNGSHLYLDFVSTSPMRNNSDWGANNVEFNIDQEQGIFVGNVKGGDPYIQLENTVAYCPSAGDVLDVRIRHNITGGSYGAMEFFYTTTDSPSFSADKYLVHSTTLHDTMTYQTVRMHLPASVVGKTINRVRIDPVSSSADADLSGRFEIDYIYLGPASKAPTANYTVRFLDESGTLLQAQSVLSGNGVTYTGQTPTKAYDDAAHYSFNGWVNIDGSAADLSAISEDTTVYASFKEQAHSLTRSVIKEATCSEDGSALQSCACGYRRTETIAKTAHTPKATAYKAPTCTQSGLSQGTYCTVCGLTLTAQQVIPATGHTEVIDKAVAPTCTETGMTEGKHCSVCGEILVARGILDALGHTEAIDKAVAPTCTETGMTEGKHCSVCGEVLVARGILDALGHTEVIDKAVAPTCTETGLTEGKHCSVCNSVLLAQRELPATGHSFDTGVITQAPTCIAEGAKTYSCHCGAAYTENIAKTDHKIRQQDAVAATCETDGCNMHYACEYCEMTFVDAAGKYPLPLSYLTIPATGHNISFCEKIEPTCEENGCNAHYLCANCKKTYADANGDYPLPQNYVVLAATGHSCIYTDNGDDHIITCKRCDLRQTQAHSFAEGACICGAKESTEPVLNTDLKFNMDITAGAEMVINYNFMASVVNAYDDFYLEVRKAVAGGESILTVYDAAKLEAVCLPNTTEPLIYKAAYTGINAKEMGDEFSATLYAVAANGKVYRSETIVSSIKNFLIAKIDTVSPEMNTMAVDMLKYGAAAQIRFGYDVENLVTDSLSEKQLAYATEARAKATDSYSHAGNGANVTTNITVGSRVELSLSCIVSGVADASNVKCVIIGNNGAVLAELATENKAGVLYSAKYDNVGAKEMRNMITATFFEGGKPISKTVRWSVESYVAQTRANAAATPEEIALVDAMLIYGDSVEAYLAASGQ